jgi:general secretion pathway protein K
MTQTRLGQRQDGFILVVVLGVVLALCALLFGFSQTTRTSLAKADSFYRTEQAWSAAWGGLQIAVATIRDVNAVCTDPRSAKLMTSENTFTIGDVNCTVTIAEENGLLNVNRLKGADGQLDRRHIEQFLRLIDVVNHQRKDLPLIGYGIVPAVIDWVDSDDKITCLPFVQRDNTGAENDDYQMDTPPRSCRNGPVDSLDELLEVKGMASESLRRLRPYLTCVGDGKIDINAAPKAVLQSLSEQIDATLAETIVQQRKLKPFKSLAELGSVPGMTDNTCRGIQSLITVNPAERFYRVRAQGNTQDHRCTMEAELRRNTQAGTVDILQYREL